ncbi:MAG: serine protease [Myxococcota bacterium]|nr:serine protease [Myxococcota bacterium]
MDADDDRGQREARSAIQERVGRATLYLLGGGRQKLPRGVGSATLLETASGRLVGLTARHVFEGDRPLQGGIRIGWFQGDDTSDSFDLEYDVPPDPSRDVAVFPIPSALDSTLRPLAIPAASVVRWSRPPSDDTVMVSGYPDALTHREMETPTRAAFGYVGICYFASAGDLRREPQRLRLSWTLMELFDGPGRHDLPLPDGMSGGGLWHYDNATHIAPSAIWTPWNALRLVGVQTSWSEERHALFFDPSDLWHGWFRAVLAC